jgi:hypothetical protein
MADYYRAPGWFTRNVFNQVVALLIRQGISVLGSRVLAVKGRTSGQWRTTPVNLLTYDGRRYLVAPRGETSGCATCALSALANCAWADAPRASAAGSSPTTRRYRCCAPT